MLGCTLERDLLRYPAGISPRDKSHDWSEDLESTPLGTEALVETPIVQDIGHGTEILPSKTLCAHQRLIDDVRTRSGKPSGKVRCLECGTVFDDPHRNTN
jgi:hypothetical protein